MLVRSILHFPRSTTVFSDWHSQGSQNKLASAIAQSEGHDDLSKGTMKVAREVQPSGGDVDRDAIEESLQARADAKIEQEADAEGNLSKGSESSRLRSAAEQYDQARKGQQAAPQAKLDGAS